MEYLTNTVHDIIKDGISDSHIRCVESPLSSREKQIREVLNWKKVWNFTHEYEETKVLVKVKDICCTEISKIFLFSGEEVTPPPTKFTFLCRFAWIRTSKKVWKLPKFVQTPLPNFEISHFFFSSENLPRLVFVVISCSYRVYNCYMI